MPSLHRRNDLAAQKACRKKDYEIFLGVDNYTDPFVNFPQSLWSEVVEVLDRGLYSTVSRLVSSKVIKRALFLGSDELDMAPPEELAKAIRKVPQEISGNMDWTVPTWPMLEGTTPPRVLFTGALRNVVQPDLGDDADLMGMMGVSPTELRALGEVVLGDGERLAAAVAETTKPYTWWDMYGTDSVVLYSYTDVLAALRRELGRGPDDEEVVLQGVYVDARREAGPVNISTP